MRIEGAKGGIAFLDSLPDIPKSKPRQSTPSRSHAAIEKAKSAINDFATFLERDLLPRSNGVYAVGEEHFNLLLKKKHFLDHDAAEPARFGRKSFRQDQARA